MQTVSFFSGAGGLDWGFHNQGFNIILANDSNKQACNTYRENFTNTIICDLFSNIDIDLIRGAECIIGGPPCQGFSVNGRMNPLDPRNRLIHDYFELVRSISPKVFVAENVAALLELHQWQEIKNNLLNIVSNDYYIFTGILNATDYGVYQSRRRSFIIGFKKRDFYENIVDDFSKNLILNRCDSRFTGMRLIDLLKTIGPVSPDNPLDCTAKIVFCKRPILRKDPYGGFLFNGQGRFTDPSKPARTVIASLGGGHTPIIDEREFFGDGHSYIREYHSHLLNDGEPGGENFIELPEYVRRLTIREARAIQSFSEEHIFVGAKSSIYKQIGNAVPPLLAKAIAKSIMQTIKI